MGDHARLSPSKRHRWGKCPGSVRECEKYEDVPGAAAQDGTDTHTLLNWCLTRELNAVDLVGQTITTKYRDEPARSFTVDGLRAERVQFCLEYVDQVIKSVSGEVKIMSEQRVDPVHWLGRSDIHGTIDLLILTPDTLEVIDLKDGFQEVLPDSPQLIQYGLGAIGQTRTWGMPLPPNVKLTILQPKRRGVGKHTGVLSVTYPLEEFAELKMGLLLEADATDKPNAPLVPGEEQCKWCNHRPNCVALKDKVMTSLGVLGGEGQQMNQNLAHVVAGKNPGTCSSEEIASFLESVPLIESLIKAFKDEAFKRMKRGDRIPGYKMVRAFGHRKWNIQGDSNPNGIPLEGLMATLKKMKVPEDAFFVREMTTPAQLKNLEWVYKPRGAEPEKRRLTTTQVENLVNQYTVVPDIGLRVVSDTDDRPAVEMTPQSIPPVPKVETSPGFDLTKWLTGG